MASRRPVIKVRRAELRDAEALQAIFAAPNAQAGTLQLPLPSVEMWRKRLADSQPTDFMLVAEADGTVVGNLGLHSVSSSPRRRHAGTIGMSVRDDWQGRGVGSALMVAALDIADNWLNYSRLELTVYTDNARALALYRKFGFETEGTLRQYAFRNGAFVDAYTMARFAPETKSRRTQRTKGTRKATKTARKRARS
jgi:putative acetyltransferase